MKKHRSSAVFLPAILVFGVLLPGCGESFVKSPVDVIVRDMPSGEVFSILLHDMDVRGNFSKTYYHSYEVIKGSRSETITSDITDWRRVSEKEFNRYINDMGMEIAARDSTGKVTKSVAPPGYNNYVGNPRYGTWQNHGGYSFWAFYGQYAFMSSMFRMATYPVRRSYYDDWRGNYSGTSRRYYGPTTGGRSYYGTGSAYSRTKNPASGWNNKRSAFKNRVNSRVGRSSSRLGSYRSRGGGFGK